MKCSASRIGLLMIALCTIAAVGQAQSIAGSYAEFRYANDFFTTTDRYYTQGVRLTQGSAFWGRLPTAKLLLELKADQAPLHGAFLQQDCYTPASIRSDSIRTRDRPFAAALYVGQEVLSMDASKGRSLKSRYLIGLLGPCAFCAEEQQWMHHGLGNIEPLGWQYQVRRDLLLNYGMQLTQRLVNGRWYRIEGIGGVEVGTYRDALRTALRIEIGAPLPADHGRIRTKWVRFTAHAQVDATLVGYDAAMQGGLLQQQDPYALRGGDLERIVPAYGWGALLRLGKLDLAYDERYIGRTFKGGLPHGWGTVSIRVWW